MNAKLYGIFAITAKAISLKDSDAGHTLTVKWAFIPGARPERKFEPDRIPLLLAAGKVAKGDSDDARRALRVEITPRTENGQWLQPISIPTKKVGDIHLDEEGKTIVTTKLMLSDLQDCGLGVEHLLSTNTSICLECNPFGDQQDLDESAAGLEGEDQQTELGFEFGESGEEGTLESDPESEISGTEEETVLDPENQPSEGGAEGQPSEDVATGDQQIEANPEDLDFGPSDESPKKVKGSRKGKGNAGAQA
jgi:hypothetical protein